MGLLKKLATESQRHGEFKFVITFSAYLLLPGLSGQLQICCVRCRFFALFLSIKYTKLYFVKIKYIPT